MESLAQKGLSIYDKRSSFRARARAKHQYPAFIGDSGKARRQFSARNFILARRGISSSRDIKKGEKGT